MAAIMQSKNHPLKRFTSLVVAALALAATFTIGGAMPQPVEAAAGKKTAAVDLDGLNAGVRPFVNKGRWAEATSRLEELIAADEKVERNQAWLAFAYLYTGKHNELKELGKKAQSMPADESDPNAKTIVAAFALTSQGKLEEAQKLLAGVRPDEKGDALLEFARACVALKKGNAAQAAEYCEKVVGLCPNFSWGYRTLGFIQDKSLKNADLAELSYEKALAIEPDFKDVRGLLVDLFLSQNDFDEAIATSQEAIKLFGKDAGNYYRLAQIYQQQWRLIEALAQLKKSVSLDKSDPRFYRAMASIYRYQGKMTEAIANQQHAVELSKDKAFELIELAALQSENQNVSGAIESLKTALKESPTNTVAHQKLVGLLKKEGRLDDLISEFKRAVELNPKLEPLRLNLADALKQSGKIDEAVAELKEAANLEQTDPRPHREIAKIELKRKNFQSAAKSYTRALNISLGSRAADSGSVEDLIALGFCYASNNDYMQAETAFTTGFAMLQLGATTGLQSNVNPSDILRSLSAVFFTEGRYREAVVNLETGVIPFDKDAEQKKLDQLMCSECKALRDRNADSLKELAGSFAALDHAGQLANLPGYIDTLFRLGKKDLTVETVKKFSESELKEKCPLVLAAGWLAEDRVKEARELISKVIEEKKDQETTASAYVELAHALLKDADRKSATEALQKAAENNPKDFGALVELGRSLLTDKKNQEALQSAQRALDVNPYCVPAHLLLGDAYMSMEKFKEAEAAFLKATELYPTSIEAHKGLLSVFQKLSRTAEAAREQEIISNLSKAS
jgi:tetratricopeptide (TPR) repeat protein